MAERPGVPATGCPYERDRWTAQAEIARMEAPEVKDWHRALEALRRINAQPSAAVLEMSENALRMQRRKLGLRKGGRGVLV